MAFCSQPRYTPQWIEHKKKLLPKGKLATVQEYEREWDDRGRLGELCSARKRELESAF